MANLLTQKTVAILLLFAAMGISGCSSPNKPKPAKTVTNQKPDVEAAYKMLKTQSDAGTVSGLKIEEYAEVGCRASKPYNLETRWELNASVTGGAEIGKKLTLAYQKAGWAYNKKASTYVPPADAPNEPSDLNYYAVLSKGAATLSIKNSKIENTKVDLFARTDCVVQPLNREPDIDPADPDYKTPTPSAPPTGP